MTRVLCSLAILCAAAAQNGMLTASTADLLSRESAPGRVVRLILLRQLFPALRRARRYAIRPFRRHPADYHDLTTRRWNSIPTDDAFLVMAALGRTRPIRAPAA